MIRRQFLKTAGAAAVAGMMAFSPMTANAGEATPAAVQNIKVPMSDGRSHSVDAVRSAAAGFSDDALVLVIYGKNDKLLMATIGAAKEAIHAGLPLKVLVVGPTGQRDSVELYADAQLYATILNPGPDVGKTISADLLSAHNEVIVPRQVAGNTPAIN